LSPSDIDARRALDEVKVVGKIITAAPERAGKAVPD
jgi:hypothetical protein